MIYLKVKWLHELDDEPVLLYSELADDRSEIRKVEVFPNGELGYAYDEVSKGTTQLSETTLPSEQEIGSDPQFQPLVISKAEFEEVWEKAISA
jgi:sirohydrochlorin ferrochelatase